jgi:hypothetical protein
LNSTSPLCDEHSCALGASPPTVFTRSTDVTPLSLPLPEWPVTVTRSHGIAVGSGASTLAATLPVIWLPSLSCHVGPPKCFPKDLPCSSKSSASGAFSVHAGLPSESGRQTYTLVTPGTRHGYELFPGRGLNGIGDSHARIPAGTLVYITSRRRLLGGLPVPFRVKDHFFSLHVARNRFRILGVSRFLHSALECAYCLDHGEGDEARFQGDPP